MSGINKIIENNMKNFRKEMNTIINFKEKTVFFALNKKYTLEDLIDMSITSNKIMINIKGEEKTFLIDKKFYLSLKQLKILIIEETELENMFKNNPILVESIVKITNDIQNKNITFEENISPRKITSMIEKELIKNIGDNEVKINYKYKEYTFD